MTEPEAAVACVAIICITILILFNRMWGPDRDNL